MNKNKAVCFALICALSIFLTASPAISGSSTSHLVPEDGHFGRDLFGPYDQAVSERLLSLRPWNCQAVFMPSFAEERAVYIKYDYSNPDIPPIVVAVKMERYLWSQMNRILESEAIENGSRYDAPEKQWKALLKIPTKVERFEAPIDIKTAKTLERTWEAMLIRVHYPEKRVRGFDGAYYHFANISMEGGFRAGKVWSPPDGSPAHDLVRLATDLWFYPTLKEPERKEAAQELKNKAQELLDRVKAKD